VVRLAAADLRVGLAIEHPFFTLHISTRGASLIRSPSWSTPPLNYTRRVNILIRACYILSPNITSTTTRRFGQRLIPSHKMGRKPTHPI